MMKLFSLVLLAVAATAEIEEEEGVLVLGDDNFDEAIKTHDILLVEFYAPWCGHCKSLAPEWSKAAKLLDAKDSSAKLAKVDATVATELAKRFEIRGFPTIKFFRSGNPLEYQGGRTAAEIVGWVDKRTGPPAKTLTTLDELSDFQESNEVFVLGVFFSADSAAAKVFLDAAGSDDTISYAITTSEEIQKKLALTGDAVVILKDFDDKRADFPITAGSLSKPALKTFIAGNSAPLIQEFSPESSKRIFSSDIKKHVLFFTKKTASHHTSIINTFTELAKSFKGQLLFVNVPSTESRVMDYFGFKEENLPATVLADMSGEGQMKKFTYSGAYETGPVADFITQFLAGKLTPTLKSEAVQPEDTTGDVVILRGSSFADIVLNNDKDVLVEFYAPWCGHCKQLEPKWNELGAKLKGVSSVVIAKMDATANEIDVPGVEVQGYPTIFFFKGDNKSKPRKYEEGREIDDFITFLENNAATAIEI